jgi:hypothetical protein
MGERIKFGIRLITLLFILLPGAAPAEEGLLQKGDMTYLGAFRLPQGTYGGSRFGYGGHGLGPYRDPITGKDTLFMEGHAWYPGQVAQVEIPDSFVKSDDWDDLPQASLLQSFYDVADGKWNTLANYMYFVYGLLAYNGRLIVGASEYYDADYSQVNSHGVSGLDLSNGNDFQGFYPMDAAANPRSLGGYMTTIPDEWRSALGGPALTGNCCLSIIGASSSGPAATVFNPDHLGTVNPIPGSTVLFYPLDHPLADVTTQNNLFNLATQMGGIAFPSGSRSVLFIGRQGTGPYCYGCGIDPGESCPADCHGECCVDPCDHSKGTHSSPYSHQVWAYDASDLALVKNGEKEPWEPRPYATWTLDDMDTSGCADIRSAGYDPLTHRLYITQGFGESPRVDVYRISSQPGANTSDLSVSFDGSGKGRVTSDPAGIDCAAAPCAAPFPINSEVTLMAAPDGDSVLAGWSACAGLGECTVSMDGDRGVIATFSYVMPARTPGPPARYYPRIGEAYAALASGGTIQARRFRFDEHLTLNRPVPVVVEGGYNTAYSGIIGATTLKGSLTVQSGSLTVQWLEIM